MSRQTRKSYLPPRLEESRGSYSKISLERRIQLIEMVIHKKLSVYRASKILAINNSTAKVIIRNFRKWGYVYRRKGEEKRGGYSVELGEVQNEQNSNKSMIGSGVEQNFPSQCQLPFSAAVSAPSTYCLGVYYPACYFYAGHLSYIG